MNIVLIAGGILAIVLLVVGLIISVQEERSQDVNRIDRYLQNQQQEIKQSSAEKSQSPLGEWVNERVQHFSWSDDLAKDLARADLKLRVGEYLAVVVISIVGLATIAWLLGGRQWLAIVIGGTIGYFLPRMYVSSQKGARLIKFDEQLSDMLNLMVNGLRAGYSTMQAMEAVSKELPPPICDEFRRVVQEMQLGVPMEKYLENLTRRIPSKDLDLVVTAINVQREVGGNLAEILSTISHTIRERVRVKGEIRVLTSQAMISAKFLSSMPILVFVALYFMNRPYILEFFSEEGRLVGIPALIIGASMIFSGYMVMQKIANIEV